MPPWNSKPALIQNHASLPTASCRQSVQSANDGTICCVAEESLSVGRGECTLDFVLLLLLQQRCHKQPTTTNTCNTDIHNHDAMHATWHCLISSCITLHVPFSNRYVTLPFIMNLNDMLSKVPCWKAMYSPPAVSVGSRPGDLYSGPTSRNPQPAPLAWQATRAPEKRCYVCLVPSKGRTCN